MLVRLVECILHSNIVPRLVRGMIGISSTRKSTSFSTQGMEVRSYGLSSIRKRIHLKASFLESEQIITRQGDVKEFFKIFQESTFEESGAEAKRMRTIAKRQEKRNQEFMFFLSMNHLILSDGKRLEWPSSPLLVLLELVDPNMLSEDDGQALETE
jgi:hypothetical protein